MTKNKLRTDSEIKKDIEAELKWDPTVEETEVGVIVKDGAVTLTGVVANLSQKTAARNVAKRIRGVRAIADDMEVKLPHQTAGSDKDIAEHIARIFGWNRQISKDEIKAEVRDGYVTLSGNVDWHYQRRSAQKQIEFIPGIKFINNNILLRKPIETDDLKNKIVKALHRHAQIEANHVEVIAKDDMVTITGHVDTYFEKELIEKTVWAAPGVHKVIDKLVIG
jgi:osmotically-inducible protein OsmY